MSGNTVRLHLAHYNDRRNVTDIQRFELSDQVTLVGQAVGALALRLDEEMETLTIEQLTNLIDWCAEVKRMMSILERGAVKAGAVLVPRDTKVLDWIGKDGKTYRTELMFKSVRTKVDKDALYGEVKKSCRVVDPSSGEVTLNPVALVETIEKTFRLEPRWTEIKSLGINPDEYCETRYEPSIQTTQTSEAQ